MPAISIKIDVLNSKELVEKKKGKLIRWVASVFVGEKALKKKVEEQVYAQVVEGLQKSLQQKLKDEGVEATIIIQIKNDTEAV